MEEPAVIRSIAIENLRGIRSGRLEGLAPLVVLVGVNGSGKSTLLDALLIGANARPHEAAARVLQRHALPAGRQWLLWRSGHAGAARIQVTTSAGETRTCTLRAPRPASERAEAGKSPATEPVQTPLAGISEVRLVEAVTRGSDPAWLRLWEQACEQGCSVQATGWMASLRTDLLDVRVVEQDGTPSLCLEYPDYVLPVSMAGDGVRKLFRLALELGTCASGGVALLEDPEVYLHPLCLRFTATMITRAVDRGVQVILGTQSLELIDALLGEWPEERLERMSLYQLALERGVLRASGIPGGDVAVLRKSIEEDLR
jgi:predicted ATPase